MSITIRTRVASVGVGIHTPTSVRHSHTCVSSVETVRRGSLFSRHRRVSSSFTERRGRGYRAGRRHGPEAAHTRHHRPPPPPGGPASLRLIVAALSQAVRLGRPPPPPSATAAPRRRTGRGSRGAAPQHQQRVRRGPVQDRVTLLIAGFRAKGTVQEPDTLGGHGARAAVTAAAAAVARHTGPARVTRRCRGSPLERGGARRGRPTGALVTVTALV